MKPDHNSQSSNDQIQHEVKCLRESVGLIELNHRDRLCLIGNDRARFLNGQVTNNIRDLQPGQGCYTLTVTNKGHIEGDAQVYCLSDELLLDLEPRQGPPLMDRLNQYIVSDDVELIDVGQQFGHISVQGPLSRRVLELAALGDSAQLPELNNTILLFRDQEGEEIYLAKNVRTNSDGYDLFVTHKHLPTVLKCLKEHVTSEGGTICGLDSLETMRIEAGIPRFPDDMTPSVLAPELGNTDRTISYTKGCYIGQEVINRIKSIGRVNRRLMGIQVLATDSAPLTEGSTLYEGEKRIGSVSSSTFSHHLNAWIGLALVKRGAIDSKEGIEARSDDFEVGIPVALKELPFSTSTQGTEES